jgi:putative acetyltransferase
MGELVIAIDDPRADDVRALLQRHLAFAYEHTPPEDVHALDVDALTNPAITFFSARRDGVVVGVGALKELDDTHAELKSMHTVSEARGQGVASAIVAHLVDVARQRGYRQVSLETGTMEAFSPARSLYASAGFTPSGPFGDYPATPNRAFMTLTIQD